MIALVALVAFPTAATIAQSAVLDDPITATIAGVARRAASPSHIGATAAGAFGDPIRALQVLAAAEKTFPNRAVELQTAELLRWAAADPTSRGSLRGRIAEEDWINRNAKDGWKKVKSPNAPQNDGYRFVNGKLEGVQIKVRKDWHDYIRDMQKDNKAEYFVLPDDQFDTVYKDYETRRIGALRGGLNEKAAEYAVQQGRMTKMGRTFVELDGSIGSAAKHYSAIAKVLRIGGKAASIVGVALALLDAGITVYEVAVGKAEVDELVTRLSKAAVGGVAAWAVGEVALDIAVAAGATGAVPVAVVIVVGTATYLVVDWAIDTAADSMRVGYLTAEDVKRVWPEGARGVRLDQLYPKPKDTPVSHNR
jgi:hypothetical protein